MTRAAFLDWVQTQDGRFEFDGDAPVAMVGGTVNHSRIGGNIYATLRERLRGTACEVLNSDAGIATVRNAVRFPDAVVTCSNPAGTGTLVPEPVIVFEVLSPSSGRIDRVVKLREYGSVGSIRRYVILEYSGVAATVFERQLASDPWTARALTADDMVDMPEISVSLPLALFYESVDFHSE
jgi:Uma2 family endonuclease